MLYASGSRWICGRLVLKNYMRNVCLGNDEPSEYSGAKQARKILEQAAALFASGTMNNEDKTTFMDEMTRLYLASKRTETSVYKGYKRDKIEMRGDRAEISDFPLYLNTVAGGLDCRDQTIGGFSFVVKIYAVPVVEIIG